MKDPICELTTKEGLGGWCERHGEFHRSRALALSQADTPAGENFRRLHDRMRVPSERRKAEITATYQHQRILVSPKGPAGPGAVLAKMLKDMGITPTPGCSCASIAREMDRLGVEGCRQNAKAIAEKMSKNSRYLSWRDKLAAAFKVASQGMFSYEALVLEACRVAEAHRRPPVENAVVSPAPAVDTDPQVKLLRAAEQVSAASPPRPYMAALKWSVGVTTVPERRHDLLPQTLDSLERAGFSDLRLFVDGPADHPWVPSRPDLPVSFRSPKLGAWSNWWLSAWELFLRCPDCDRYAIFQDDLVAVRNLRPYLEAVPFPERGYLNLFSFSSNEQLMGPDSPRGIVEAALLPPPSSILGNPDAMAEWRGKRLQCGRGALALIFNRPGLVALLGFKDTVERPLEHPAGRGVNRIDGGVVDSMNKMGWREHVHNPGLVQHTGHKSAIGNGSRRDGEGRTNGVWRQRLSASFPGEEFDAMTLLKEK